MLYNKKSLISTAGAAHVISHYMNRVTDWFNANFCLKC